MNTVSNPKKCVFLDRDGVINEERGDYTYRIEDFHIIPGVTDALKMLKEANYILIVITNQAGISKGIYTREQMQACHNKLHEATENAIEHIYYCPYHHLITNSLCRKPGTLMVEKARAKFNIDLSQSWFVGDAERDIECGLQMGLKTIRINEEPVSDTFAHYQATGLLDAVNHYILTNISFK